MPEVEDNRSYNTTGESSNISSTNTLSGKYEIGKLLGCGAFAKVYHARDVRTGQNVAIKAVSRQKVLKGGEDLSRRYFQQLISTVRYCHSRGVFHRDLKPENLLLDDNYNLKITDFRLSAILLRGSHSEELKKIKCVVQYTVVMAHHLILETSFLMDQKAMFSTIPLCGIADVLPTDQKSHTLNISNISVPCLDDFTAEIGSNEVDIPISNGYHEEGYHVNDDQIVKSILDYSSALSLEPYNPAIFSVKSLNDGQPQSDGYNGAKVDVWSCGIILYVMHAGYLPFNDPNLMRFICRLLDPNPDTRITVDEIINDPWFKKGYKEIKSHDDDFKFKEETQSKKFLNAFDIISFSLDFDLSGLFDEVEPPVQREKFISEERPEKIIEIIEEEVGRTYNLKVKKKIENAIRLEA
ncbi:Non-LTR retroelement reverse transcriptase-like protein [Hibiscus syriacus]|uniref:non-specific serine/threonine protein kinase n=1 Tax=Hibiscus syriacus TaxID=106335 RepID=A0A6A3AS03_HIBSY|nr:Non-LTR retroelement reverse transcriptase-like protein [Hibiscus syriacus]